MKRHKAESHEEENTEYALFHLPWQRGAVYSYEPSGSFSGNMSQNDDINPGEFVLRALFTEFTVLAERKIERLLKEPLVSLKFDHKSWTSGT